MIEIDLEGLGQRIAHYRKLNGWTAEQLAVRASAGGSGISREVLAKIETGRRTDLGLSTVLSIAWALRVPPAALIFPITDPDRPVPVDGSEVPVAELVEWFHATDQLNPFDLAQTNARLDAVGHLQGLGALSRAHSRLSDLEADMNDHPEDADIPQRLELAQRDVDVAKNLLRMTGVRFRDDATDG